MSENMNGAVDLRMLQSQREQQAEIQKIIKDSGLIEAHGLMMGFQPGANGQPVPAMTLVGVCPSCFVYVPIAFGQHHMATHNGTPVPPMPGQEPPQEGSSLLERLQGKDGQSGA